MNLDNLLRRGNIITRNDSYYYQRWYEIEEPEVRLEMEMEGDIQVVDIQGSSSGEWGGIGMVNTMLNKTEKFDE